MREANEVIRSALISASSAQDARAESSLSEIESASASSRTAIALCRSLRVADSEQAAAAAREKAMIEALSAANAAGVFVKRGGREGVGGGGATLVEEVDRILLEEVDSVLLDNAAAVNGRDGDGDGTRCDAVVNAANG
ncbi:unnamed protein product [Closterium sp. Yama58-4]|nr:unnamed protein product [Closterium sp. Yama58-4]